MKYHVIAWGHPELDDIDEEVEELPSSLKEYPMQSVALLTPISRQAIVDAMKENKMI